MSYQNRFWISKPSKAMGFVSGLILTVCLAACEAERSNSDNVDNEGRSGLTQSVAADAQSELDAQNHARTTRLWSTSCALCHVSGNAGAPRVGIASDWLPRLGQGSKILLQHTIDGFNDMPPLGYCMACERADFVAMIEFMTVGIKPAAQESKHD